MTLNKIKSFAQTRDAASFAKGIEFRVEGAAQFAISAPARQAPLWKNSVA
jgi:hypothetical protein